MFVSQLGTPVLANAKSRRGRGLHRAQTVRFGHGSRHRTDDRNAIQNGEYASSHDCRVNCGLRSADRRGRRLSRSRGVQRLGRATDMSAVCPPESCWTTMRSSRRLAGTLPAASQMHAAPDPRARTGWSGASPHVLRFPCGLSSGFPFARRALPLRPPSPVSLRPAFSGSVPSAAARFRFSVGFPPGSLP